MVESSAIRDTQNVLDSLVAKVTSAKAQKATRLTPTVSEIKVAPFAKFPWDDPQTMLEALRVARLEVVHVLEGIDHLLAGLGGTVAPQASPADSKKLAEKAADEAHFARQFAAQQAEAQAVAFRKHDDPLDEAGAKAARIAAMKAELEALG